MTLPFLTTAARRELVRIGRDDLALKAVEKAALTFDGSEMYVHIFPRPTWRRRYSQEAFVLAHAELVDLPPGLAGIRELIADAKLSLAENGVALARWLENH